MSRQPLRTALGLLASADPEALVHVATALRGYRRALEAARRPVPESLADLLDAAEAVARSGQTLARAEPAVDDRRSHGAVLLDGGAVASILGVSERTVRRLIAGGSLRATRVGRLVRVHPADLAEYIDRRREPA